MIRLSNVSIKRALTFRWLTGGPRPLRFALGLAAVVAGALVIARPTTSLDLLAVLVGVGAIIEGLLAAWETAASKRWRTITMAIWIALGTAILLTPWLTVVALTYVVALGLGTVGVSRIVLAVRRPHTLDARIVLIAFGIAALIFAAIVLIWQDITMVIVAVVFGAWLIISGIQGMWEAARGARSADRPRSSPGAFRRVLNAVVAVITVTAAVTSVIATVAITQPAAVSDPFYAAPRTLPDEPGRLVRAEPFTDNAVPSTALAWRILYTTIDAHGELTVASGLVVAPNDSSRHPVISWAHGTTGYAQNCAPSLLDQPFASGSMYILRQVIAEGWALVATDYIGLGTSGKQPYLLGKPTAHAILDATRAAIELDGTRLSRRTVLWGHSQGGHGALWAAQSAASYAPSLVVEGVAAVSAASDLPALVDTMPNVLGGAVLSSYVLTAYEDAYDDVAAEDYLRPGSELAMSEYPKRCLSGPESWVSALSVAARYADSEVFRVSPLTGRLGAHLRENVPTPPRDMPTLLATGSADALLSPAVQSAYADSLCERSLDIDHRVIAGEDHVSMLYSVSDFVPALKQWTRDRLLGAPSTPTCGA